jgi:hypothetical protein
VVGTDIGEQRDGGLADVGRVPATAEPRLQHGQLDAAGGEVQERRRGQRLEVGELGETCEVGDQLPQLGRRDRLAGHPDALLDPKQVGRRVQAGAHAVGFENSCKQHRGRSLTVGADDQHGRTRALRVAEGREGALDALQAG